MLEEWKDGRMEEWKDGMVERWNGGKMEWWKDGRVRSKKLSDSSLLYYAQKLKY